LASAVLTVIVSANCSAFANCAAGRRTRRRTRRRTTSWWKSGLACARRPTRTTMDRWVWNPSTPIHLPRWVAKATTCQVIPFFVWLHCQCQKCWNPWTALDAIVAAADKCAGHPTHQDTHTMSFAPTKLHTQKTEEKFSFINFPFYWCGMPRGGKQIPCQRAEIELWVIWAVQSGFRPGTSYRPNFLLSVMRRPTFCPRMQSCRLSLCNNVLASAVAN